MVIKYIRSLNITANAGAFSASRQLLIRTHKPSPKHWALLLSLMGQDFEFVKPQNV